MNKASAPLRDRCYPLLLVGAASLHCAMPKPNCHSGLGARNYPLLQADDPIYTTEHSTGVLIFPSFPVHCPPFQPLWVAGRTAGSCLPWLGAEASPKPSLGKCAVVIVLNCWLQTSSLLSKDTFYKFANLHVAKIPCGLFKSRLSCLFLQSQLSFISV